VAYRAVLFEDPGAVPEELRELAEASADDGV